MTKKMIQVVVGIIVKADQVCLTKRKDNVHLAGLWEFPGGKVEVNESLENALFRELNEEINIIPTKYKHYEHKIYHYSDRSVSLDFYLVEAFSGVLLPRENQQLTWVSVENLKNYQLPEANLSVIDQLIKDTILL